MASFKQKSLVDLAREVDSAPEEIWKILMGDIIQDAFLALKLQDHLNISAKNFIFHKNNNIRFGVLDWFSENLGVSKTTVYRYIHGYCPPNKKNRKKIQNFSGLNPSAWDMENADANWMLSQRGRQKIKRKLNGKRK